MVIIIDPLRTALRNFEGRPLHKRTVMKELNIETSSAKIWLLISYTPGKEGYKLRVHERV